MLSCFSYGLLFATLRAFQAPLSIGFSRQEYWSGLPCSPPGDLPNPGIKPPSLAWQANSLPSETPKIKNSCKWDVSTFIDWKQKSSRKYKKTPRSKGRDDETFGWQLRNKAGLMTLTWRCLVKQTSLLAFQVLLSLCTKSQISSAKSKNLSPPKYFLSQETMITHTLCFKF